MQLNKSNLTQSQLKEIVEYDPLTGIFTWNTTDRQKKKIKGNRAGSEHLGSTRTTGKTKYRTLTVNRCAYLEHRLAWFYMTGTWPKNHIDHIDQNGLNNKFDNLREAVHGQNLANVRLKSNNKSGYKGVSWHTAAKKWEATINFNRAKHWLGLFVTKEEAALAYNAKATELYGEFAYLNIIPD